VKLSVFGRPGDASLIGLLAMIATLSACGFVLGDAAPDAEPTRVPTPPSEVGSTPVPTPSPTSTPAPTRIAVPFPALPAPTVPAPAVNVFGVPTGDDAAPASEQYLTLNYNSEGSAMDFAVSALDRAGGVREQHEPGHARQGHGGSPRRGARLGVVGGHEDMDV